MLTKLLLKWEIISHLLDTYFFNNHCNYSFGIAVALALIIICATISFCTRKQPKGCLDPKRYKEFKLVKRTKVSHNTDRFRFALPTPKSVLGLPVGQHIRCRGKDSEGQEVVKPYTPITLDSDTGYFELVVKMYPQGRMSYHFRNMREGDFLPVIGPLGRFTYRIGQVRAFGMLAGGTGITPMYQIIRAILENPKDQTKIHLVYANHTVDDILLKASLNWNAGIGNISKDMIRHHCPPAATDTMILRCGPPGMNKVMAAYLNELGYTPEMQFEF